MLAAAEPSLAADGVLVTTTSSLPVAELASALAAPERFAAWHWFHPADLMALVEIVPGERTEPEVLATLRTWSSRSAAGRSCCGATCRASSPTGCSTRCCARPTRSSRTASARCADVDLAVTAGLGARWAALGPFATMDLAGLEVHAAVAGGAVPAAVGHRGAPGELVALRANGAGGARAGRGLLGDYAPERFASSRHAATRPWSRCVHEHR